MEFIFDKDILGVNIKHLRKQKGLTQNALSEIIGSKSTTLSNWEVGFSTPELEKVVLLSNYFGISIDNLVLIHHDKWGKPYLFNKVYDSDCLGCSEKERTITTQSETISLLKEKIESQKDKISILEKGSGSQNSTYSQTA